MKYVNYLIKKNSNINNILYNEKIEIKTITSLYVIISVNGALQLSSRIRVYIDHKITSFYEIDVLNQ